MASLKPEITIIGAGIVGSPIAFSFMISSYYGIRSVCLSIPAQVSKNGAEHYLQLELSDFEQEQFIHSANTLRGIIKAIGT